MFRKKRAQRSLIVDVRYIVVRYSLTAYGSLNNLKAVMSTNWSSTFRHRLVYLMRSSGFRAEAELTHPFIYLLVYS